jgi:hypothetical protein
MILKSPCFALISLKINSLFANITPTSFYNVLYILVVALQRFVASLSTTLYIFSFFFLSGFTLCLYLAVRKSLAIIFFCHFFFSPIHHYDLGK